MIEIHQLVKTYPGGVQALRGVNLQIGETGMFGLLGPNGAGKTTLMRILSCILEPTSGQVRVFGNDLKSPPAKQAVKAFLGYLPQEMGFQPELTAAEFLDYVAILKGINDPHQRKKQIATLLAQMHLEKFANRPLKTFSGGMKRRAGIAQALLGAPRLVIVDEPTAGLDPEERVNLRNILSETARRCLVILSTHIVEDISQSCSDLAIIHHGQVLHHSSPLDLAAAARGHVWRFITQEAVKTTSMRTVSAIQTAEGIEYRVVGEAPPGVQAIPVEPSLEDGYLWRLS